MVQSITSHWNTRYLQEAIKLDDYGKHGALANNFTETLPILSTYLGHQSLRATNNYVRLTSEMYPELIRKIDIIGFDIFPKM
jgi:hypothetical protein